MSFKSKKLPKNNLGFLKGATLFFLGTSVVLFMANAFEIVPSVPNAIQYIANIVLTQEGTNTSTTGVILQGSGGHAWFKGDVSIASLPSKACLGTDSNGKITEWTCWAGGSDTKVGTGEEGKRCIFTGDKIVCDQNMPIGITGAVWPEGPQWPVWATGAVWPEGPQWPAWATWTFEGIETDPIFSGGEEGKRCILENGKIECTQNTPAGGTWAQPAGNVTNIQFKNTNNTLSGTNSFVWKDDKLGIGTSGPTEKFQIGDYIWMGKNTSVKTWGSFLRIYWLASEADIVTGYIGDPELTEVGELDEGAPNIQLNLTKRYGVRPLFTYDSYQRQIKNIGSFLHFNFFTGDNYLNAFAIGSNGSVGIGTTTPTEKFQIGDYAWMGQNTSVKTWGSFLRMYGLDLGNPALNDKPNVQLNYRTISYSLPSGEAINNDNNRQIKNNKDFLEFNFSTWGDYTNKFAIGLDGSAGIGSSMRIGGNMNVTSGRITLWYTGTDLDSFSGQSTPTNSMYISNKVVVWSPYLNNNEQNSNIKLIVRGGMKLGQIGTGDECNSYSFWTIGIQQTNDRPDWVTGEPSGWYDYKLVICLANLGGYQWRRLDNI